MSLHRPGSQRVLHISSLCWVWMNVLLISDGGLGIAQFGSNPVLKNLLNGVSSGKLEELMQNHNCIDVDCGWSQCLSYYFRPFHFFYPPGLRASNRSTKPRQASQDRQNCLKIHIMFIVCLQRAQNIGKNAQKLLGVLSKSP